MCRLQSDEEERKRRAAIVQERIEHGVCRKCGAAPALPGRQLCSKCAELGKKTELDIKEMHNARDMRERIAEMDANHHAEHSPKVLNRIIKTVDVEDDDEVRAS